MSILRKEADGRRWRITHDANLVMREGAEFGASPSHKGDDG